MTNFFDTYTQDLIANGDTIIFQDGFYMTHLGQWRDRLTAEELYVQILQTSLRENDALLVVNAAGEYDILETTDIPNVVLQQLIF